MAIAALKIKIMPSSLETDIEMIRIGAEKIIGKFKAKLHSHEISPIAFGLNALILTIAWPEEQEQEQLEEALRKIENVESVEVIDFRRAIG